MLWFFSWWCTAMWLLVSPFLISGSFVFSQSSVERWLDERVAFALSLHFVIFNGGRLPPLTMILYACHGIFNFSCHEIIFSFNHCLILRFWSVGEKSIKSGWLSVVNIPLLFNNLIYFISGIFFPKACEIGSLSVRNDKKSWDSQHNSESWQVYLLN